jgi:hypothetical protein
VSARHTYGERSICRRCDLEIEFHGKRTWADRGNNTHCPKGDGFGAKHQPNSLQGELLELGK